MNRDVSVGLQLVPVKHLNVAVNAIESMHLMHSGSKQSRDNTFMPG